MKWMTWTGTQLVPLGGVPAGPGPDPEDPKLPPPAVISLAVTSPSPTQLSASWLAPQDPNAGGVISHYQVDLDGDDYNWSLTSTSIVFDDLTPGAEYTVTVRAVNNYGLVGPSVAVEVSTQSETPYDADLGTIGNRPALTERPDETNTGPRQSITQTWSTAQLESYLNSTAGLEGDGWRYVRRTRIVGLFRYNRINYRKVIFEDCIFDGAGTYAIEGYGVEALPGTDLPEYRFCEIRGGSSACVRDGGLRLLRCNIHRGVDLIKTNGPGSEYYACYLHDTRHDIGAHCDVVQIRNGSENVLFHWNNLQAFNAPESESGGGGTSNGGLQTGKVDQDIGPVTWLNNWFNGGHYTIRVGNSTDLDGYSRQYVFKNNRWGRDFQYGPLYWGVETGLDFDDTNVWDDTGLPVRGNP